jgi:hypothetical protein
MIKSIAHPSALEQKGPDKGFKGISYSDADCHQERGSIEEVDQKRSQQNGRPKTIPKKKQCCHCGP